MPTAEWFNYAQNFADIGVKHWLGELEATQSYYEEFKLAYPAYSPFRYESETQYKFIKWLNKTHNDTYKSLVWVGKRPCDEQGNKQSPESVMGKLFRKWEAVEKSKYTANRDEEL